MRAIPDGYQTTLQLQVTEAMTVNFEELGKLHPVYATYWVGKHFEEVGRKLILPFLEEGEETIGTQLEVKHTASTLVGMKVIITATFIKREGRRLYAEMRAVNELGDEIATGTTTQALLPKEKIDDNFAMLKERWKQYKESVKYS